MAPFRLSGKAIGTTALAVVGGYTKIEDAFVEKYMLHDGETVEDAKKRLKNERT